MYLQFELVSDFKANINGVEFDDQYLCDFVYEFLDVFDEKYTLEFSREFVAYLKGLAECLYKKSVNITYEMLTDLFLNALYDSTSPEDVADYVFNVYTPIYDAIGGDEAVELHKEFKQKLSEYF